MPNPVNNRKDQQWDTCERCGRLFPMGDLTMQKGLLICRRICFDNLTVERMPFVIGQVLGTATDQEGADLRVVDRGFFQSGDDEGVI